MSCRGPCAGVRALNALRDIIVHANLAVFAVATGLPIPCAHRGQALPVFVHRRCRVIAQREDEA